MISLLVAGAVSLVVSVVGTPALIRWLQVRGIGQPIGEDGPQGQASQHPQAESRGPQAQALGRPADRDGTERGAAEHQGGDGEPWLRLNERPTPFGKQDVGPHDRHPQGGVGTLLGEDHRVRRSCPA